MQSIIVTDTNMDLQTDAVRCDATLSRQRRHRRLLRAITKTTLWVKTYGRGPARCSDHQVAPGASESLDHMFDFTPALTAAN